MRFVLRFFSVKTEEKTYNAYLKPLANLTDQAGDFLSKACSGNLFICCVAREARVRKTSWKRKTARALDLNIEARTDSCLPHKYRLLYSRVPENT